HRLEQRGLRLRRSAIDLVGEEQIRENRPGTEFEVGGALVEDRRTRHVAGHQVGCELDAGEAHRRGLRERPRNQRFRKPWKVFDQHVTIGENAQEDELERLALADDGPLELRDEFLRLRGELLDRHSASNRSMKTVKTAGSTPGPDRRPTSRSARTSSQSSSPSSCWARSG